MADIAEQICLAVDQIVLERLKNIKYDTTIVATIVDNKQAADYKYICSNGSAQFVAFSKDTGYKVNDSVQVTIPNGDYDQQKIIIGKYVADDETPYVYTRPFETIIDLTANLIDKNPTSGLALRANDDKIPDENLLWSKIFEEGFYDFERLGIQGQFSSRLKTKSLNPVTGDYGYRLEIISSKEEVVSDSKNASNAIKNLTAAYLNKTYNAAILNSIPDDWFNKVANELELQITETEKTFKSVFISTFSTATEEVKAKFIKALLYANARLTELYLSSSDMYGDPYNFQSYFEQEKVYDISTLNTIYGMSLYFYEESGSFLNRDGEPIPYMYPTGGKREPNLYTKDPYICLGYDLSSFQSEQAILFSTSNSTYTTKDGVSLGDSNKHIRLRWLHQYEDGHISTISEASDLEDYEIRWYRYKLGAPSADEYCGVYWTRIENDSNSFYYLLEPAPNTSSEQIKVIILYNGEVIRSNILTFTNEAEVASSATAEVISGLSIWCKDGSYGNYCRYGQNNQLMDSVQSETDKKANGDDAVPTITANTVFSLEARFADKSILAEHYSVDAQSSILREAKEIIWEFPLQNSMIIVQGFNYAYPIYDNEWSDANKTIPNYNLIYKNDEENGGARYKQSGFYEDAIISVRGNSIYIKRQCAADGQIDAIQDYRINKTFNASALNNTVKCTILKNGLVYSATKEFTFGLMGTNGTDATIVIDFDNNKTALTANVENETLKVVANLYGADHKRIPLENKTEYPNVKVIWSWDRYKVYDNQDVIIEQRWTEDNSVEGGYRERDASIPQSTCYLSHNSTLNINSKEFFLILKVTIKGFGDYDLIGYKGIPIRADRSYRNMIGPTEVIYGTAGHPNYYKDKISLWHANLDNIDNTYDVVLDETKVSPVSSKWAIYDPFDPDDKSRNFRGTIENNILKPAQIYIKDADPYGIYCYLNSADGSSTTPVWLQPLVIMQNEYPSTTINKWNGKDISIEPNEGFIIAPAIAAGRKGQDNKFYGVMIGDWSATNTSNDITNNTGVYGFHKGVMSFAFKDDGTAFIGKSGSGRIEIDGDNGTIRSAKWTNSNQSGMFLDLDDGILKLQREGGYDYIRLEKGAYTPGKYYIIHSTYKPVALNTAYDMNTIYYKIDLVPLYEAIDADSFNTKKNKGILYYKTDAIFNFCKPGDAYKPPYYIQKHVAVENLTEEMFRNEPSRYYTEKDGAFIQCNSATEFASEGVTYYTLRLFDASPTEEEFYSNPTIYLTTEERSIVKVESSDAFDKEKEYYQEAYIAQNYGISKPFDSWNTSEDPGLKEGECYYTCTETTYVISNDPFDPYEIYYEDHTGEEARYITLSSATSRYPLAIGNNVSESGRKFRVDWDGTCYIVDGEFSGNINANTGTLGELTLEGGLTVTDGGYINLNSHAEINISSTGALNIDEGGDINIGSDGAINIDQGGMINIGIQGGIKFEGSRSEENAGSIDLGKNAYITMSNGGYLQLSSSGGRIFCDKTSLTDFKNSGFWLDFDGFHNGNYINYFITTPSYTGFYNVTVRSNGQKYDLYPGVVKISGSGLDLFASQFTSTDWTTEQFEAEAITGLSKIQSSDEGAIHVGWEPVNQYFHPFLRLGFGTMSMEFLTEYGQKFQRFYMSDAAAIKKYTSGIWIGNYGTHHGTASSPNQDDLIFCGMHFKTGTHFPVNRERKVLDGTELPTVYRCEVIQLEKDGEKIYQTVYEPARYARFA